MLPSALLVLEKMPHTPNQKIDRRALARPEGGQGQAGYLKPRNDLEFRLAALWQEVLEVERVGIRDNFFELGGHSLVAVRLFTRIEQEFGLSLPLLLLFQNGTVETLAVALAAAEKARDQEAVVTIQPHGNAAPLFILTGGVYMRDLALALGSSRPIYGLFPYQGGRPVFGASIEETARIYRQRLLEFHPQGPFLLLGHSAYGYFALELARQLGADGKRVAFLGLLDTYAPGNRFQASLADRIKIHVTNLQEQDLAGGFRYVKRAAWRLANRWRWIGLPGRTGVTREQEGKFKDIAPRLVGAYHPSSYDQPVTLFVAERRPWFMRWDPMAAWADILTGPVDVVAIPGDHMSMLKPPQAAALAERLLAALNRNAPS
jgi:thioesterase domain-containing protein/acyl carrier protein